jgi:hypothetical protein
MKTISMAAGVVLLFATASSIAYAQGTPKVACVDPQVAAATTSPGAKAPQKAGEGEGQYARQNAGEGEGQYARQKAGEGEGQYARQKAGEGEGQYARQNAAAATPCKG